MPNNPDKNRYADAGNGTDDIPIREPAPLRLYVPPPR